ncbi:hypothetical protein PIB30_060924 [Stylosanthes scabra]|uniref:Uncharacterized protein n=1 Tax=Stylosanthes scabra TaxID=79078 RepID=A0ABU6SL26_9FABA|nr:hypothetical protein [Stylosanthes scabra]
MANELTRSVIRSTRPGSVANQWTIPLKEENRAKGSQATSSHLSGNTEERHHKSGSKRDKTMGFICRRIFAPQVNPPVTLDDNHFSPFLCHFPQPNPNLLSLCPLTPNPTHPRNHHCRLSFKLGRATDAASVLPPPPSSTSPPKSRVRSPHCSEHHFLLYPPSFSSLLAAILFSACRFWCRRAFSVPSVHPLPQAGSTLGGMLSAVHGLNTGNFTGSLMISQKPNVLEFIIVEREKESEVKQSL